ncbi:Flp pilus assembly protein CpaB [Streptomyces qinzhouensis]|uniref:Flp pilus assembly protein CpaB n=1 Tax=Streptomyces qinzhouensis TaxID=2599401 RepID=A0A5B8IK23_9ACTN|nr:Flp pilus assembly protein CpaB [Streptomyces qinzhouensis]QDY78792.1 Flp pilus assembly protein CpaB [Streptomyces qinzhouensis]
MNSRQRRGVILLTISVLCALAAFAGVIAVIGDVNSKVGPEVTAYRVKTEVAPYTALRPDQFEKTSIPERWLSDSAVTDLDGISGRIAVTTLRKGSLLQTDMIVKRPALAPGEQEIAIMVDAATGVAGKITPGDLVNIFATFEGRRDSDPDESRIIVSRARVIDVGRLTPITAKGDERRDAAREAVPITFALTTADAQRVAYAESFAENVRLALLAKSGPGALKPGDSTYTLDEDKNR